MAQDFLIGGAKDADLFIGQALLGSVLNRKKLNLNDGGSSDVSYTVPTISIAGSRDGCSRLSRTAEAYWH